MSEKKQMAELLSKQLGTEITYFDTCKDVDGFYFCYDGTEDLTEKFLNATNNKYVVFKVDIDEEDNESTLYFN